MFKKIKRFMAYVLSISMLASTMSGMAFAFSTSGADTLQAASASNATGSDAKNKATTAASSLYDEDGNLKDGAVLNVGTDSDADPIVYTDYDEDHPILAAIYTDSTYKVLATRSDADQASASNASPSDSTLDASKSIIALTGEMPEGAIAKAYPVEVSIAGINVLASYDITIFDAKGLKYEPDTDHPVSVSINAPQLEQVSTVDVYHIATADDGTGTALGDGTVANNTVQTVDDTDSETGDEEAVTATVKKDTDASAVQLTATKVGTFDVAENPQSGKVAEVVAADAQVAKTQVTFDAKEFSIYVCAGPTDDSVQGQLITDGATYNIYTDSAKTVYFYCAPHTDGAATTVTTAHFDQWTQKTNNIISKINSEAKDYDNSTSQKKGDRSCSIVTVELNGEEGNAEISCHYTVGNSDTTETCTISVHHIAAVSITDNVASTSDAVAGCLTATLKNAETQKILSENEMQAYTFTWFKGDSADGTFTQVTNQQALKKDGHSVNVAVDKGSQKFYKLEVMKNNQRYGSAIYQVPYFDELQNGSFENDIESFGNNKSYLNQQYQNGHSDLIWKTTGPGQGNMTGHDIEIVDSENGSCEKQFHTTTAANNTRYFAELNCENYGALYQDVITAPGSTMNWSFYHRARNNKNNDPDHDDKMAMIIMPTEDAKYISTQGQLKELLDGENCITLPDGAKHNVNRSSIKIQEASDDNCSWYVHSSSQSGNSPYLVPNNQYLTRFFFMAVSTCSGNATVGNLIDEITFSEKMPSYVQYFVDGEPEKDPEMILTAELPANWTDSIKALEDTNGLKAALHTEYESYCTKPLARRLASFISFHKK